MTPEAVETGFLRTVVNPELQAEGYDVYLSPKRPRLPAFFGHFVPDAIALGEKKNFAVEILRRSPTSTRKLEEIRGLLEGHDDWELRVFWAEPVSAQKNLPPLTPDVARKSLMEIRELSSRDNPAAALLLCWATFEAIGRMLVPGQLERPQPPGRLLRVLAQGGYVTPDEADQLRRLANLRNELSHGGLAVSVEPSDVETFVDVLETLLVEVK